MIFINKAIKQPNSQKNKQSIYHSVKSYNQLRVF